MAMKTHQSRLSVCSTNELNAIPRNVAVTIQTSENLRTTRPRLLMYSLIVMTTHPIVWGQSMRPHDAGGRLAVTHDRLLSGSEIFAGSTKEKPGPWPGLSVQTGVRLSSDALLLATTQYQEATDEQRQPTSG